MGREREAKIRKIKGNGRNNSNLGTGREGMATEGEGKGRQG